MNHQAPEILPQKNHMDNSASSLVEMDVPTEISTFCRSFFDQSTPITFQHTLGDISKFDHVLSI